MTYRIAPAPKNAQFTCFDCADCGHPELGSPVFLARDGGSPTAFGSGCAARLLGLPVAEVAATIAATQLAEVIAADYRASNAWSDFSACLPGRVTAKFIRDTVAHTGCPTETVEAIGGLYKILAAVGAVRSFREIIAA
jgi:hypothetical protein